MKARDFRASAWSSLNGKWVTMAIIYLIYELIIGFCAGFIFVGTVALIIVAGPLYVGYTGSAIKTARGINPDFNDLFSCFKNLTPSIILYVVNNIFIFLWSLLFFIPGIVKSYAYSMSYFVLNDNPSMTASEARAESVMIMKGNKWRLFCLDFSFFGWYILSVLTCGILLFWVAPYHRTATAKFYDSIRMPSIFDAINENGGEQTEWQPNDDGDSTKGSSDFFN